MVFIYKLETGKKQGEVTQHPKGEIGKNGGKKYKVKLFFKESKLCRDSKKWQTLIDKCTGKKL